MLTFMDSINQASLPYGLQVNLAKWKHQQEVREQKREFGVFIPLFHLYLAIVQ